MKIVLNDKELAFAHKCANRITDTTLMKTPNYTGLHMPDRFYKGYCGEFAVIHLLRHYQKQFIYSIVTKGLSDAEDIILTLVDGRRVKVDVKTAWKRYWGTRQMLPLAQYKRHPYDAYVAVDRAHENTYVVEGYCYGNELKTNYEGFGDNIPTMHIDYENLRPIERLLDQTIEGDGVIILNGRRIVLDTRLAPVF